MLSLRRAASVLAVALALAGAGCGNSGPEEAPAACLAGPGAYLRALTRAPAEVRLQGQTLISECLLPAQGGGELADVGSSMVRAATRLNVAARSDLTGPEALELGYLIGAAQRGAADTSGIHTDLIRRLNAAARFSPSGILPAPFERTFGRGYAAGRASG
jgi:hypothetical protein